MVSELFQNGSNGRLYHFTKTKIALDLILPKMQLKLSLFANANDPKESMCGTDFKIIQNYMNLPNIHLKDDFNNYMLRCKHLSFTKDDKTHYGYRHSPMWEHYAEQWSGVCLVLDKKNFIQQNNDLINDDVDYTEVINFPTIDKNCIGETGCIENFVNKNTKELLFKKHRDWQYEDEYKFVTFDNYRSDFCSIKDSLIFVIFGFNMSLENKLKFGELVNINQLAEMVFSQGNLLCRPFYPHIY
jgi:Protein of unknown function (DUF2971).